MAPRKGANAILCFDTMLDKLQYSGDKAEAGQRSPFFAKVDLQGEQQGVPNEVSSREEGRSCLLGRKRRQEQQEGPEGGAGSSASKKGKVAKKGGVKGGSSLTRDVSLAALLPQEDTLSPLLLILGSAPGVVSLQQQQYYAYKTNAFWYVMSNLLEWSSDDALASPLSLPSPSSPPSSPARSSSPSSPSSVSALPLSPSSPPSASKGKELPPYEERVSRIVQSRVAVWDVCQSFTRRGSEDATLVCEEPNDICKVLKAFPSIETVAFNGGTAAALFKKHFIKTGLVPSRLRLVTLPSTSPAHAMKDAVERKTDMWRERLGDDLVGRLSSVA